MQFFVPGCPNFVKCFLLETIVFNSISQSLTQNTDLKIAILQPSKWIIWCSNSQRNNFVINRLTKVCPGPLYASDRLRRGEGSTNKTATKEKRGFNIFVLIVFCLAINYKWLLHLGFFFRPPRTQKRNNRCFECTLLTLINMILSTFS